MMAHAGPSEAKSRIAIAFASESVDVIALETVMRLAATLQAEITGLFVEDINLIRLASLPVSRALSRSGVPQALDVAEMERQLQAQAETVRHTMSAIAERAGVPWSFEVARGSLASEIVRAAAEGDLVALGITRRLLLAETLELSAGRRPREVSDRQARPIVTVFTGSPAAERALKLALSLSETMERPLVVFLVAKDDAAADKLRQSANTLLAPRKVRFRRLIDPTVAALRDAADAEHAALLLVEQGAATLDPAAVRLLNDELRCPSLIVR